MLEAQVNKIQTLSNFEVLNAKFLKDAKDMESARVALKTHMHDHQA